MIFHRFGLTDAQYEDDMQLLTVAKPVGALHAPVAEMAFYPDGIVVRQSCRERCRIWLTRGEQPNANYVTVNGKRTLVCDQNLPLDIPHADKHHPGRQWRDLPRIGREELKR